MGRPLSKDMLKTLNMTVETKDGEKKLISQCGYNKYIVDEEKHEIVRLSEVLVEDDDAVLSLSNGEKVLKVMRNYVQTAKGIYPYTFSEDGKEVVFADADISFQGAKADGVKEEPQAEAVTSAEVEPVSLVAEEPVVEVKATRKSTKKVEEVTE